MEAVGKAFLGTAIGELMKPMSEARKKAGAFDEMLKKLKSILKLIGPIVHQIKQLSGDWDHPEESEKLIQLFEEGEKLIQKYYRCHWVLNYIKYRHKITDFYNSLLLFFQFHIPLEQFKTNMEFLADLEHRLKSPIGILGADEIGHFGPCYAPKPPDFMVGLDVPLIEMKKLLFEDGASVIVVSAPGGCGKTTLVQKLCQDPDVKGKFQGNIFYVTVSKVHDIKLMIRKLFRHMRFLVLDFQTDDEAINQLEELLKIQARKSPILLVLDDVWDETEFPLQKFVFKIPEYRILVTSRDEFPSFGPPYKLKLLNHDDAVRLFRHSASLTDEDFPLYDDFDADVNEIVKRCGGFPLALEVTAGSLRGQPIEIWKSRTIELSQGESVFDSGERLLKRLELSLSSLNGKPIKKKSSLNGKPIKKKSSLNGKLMECFMDLGLFPEDQKIPVTALIDMWAELYQLNKNSMQALSKVHKLSSRNLLNLVVTRKNATEAEGCYDDAYVLQHDLLRDLAIHQSSQKPMEERKRLILDLSGNKLPDWWIIEKQPCIEAQLLSISTDEMFSSRWCNMQVPKVEVLILNFQTREKNYTLPEFMRQMDKLKVLVLTNYGSSIPELTNFSVLGSLSSLKRIRLERVSIPTLHNTMVELKNLEKITLVMCKINQAFNTCADQIPAMLPSLMEINIDSCNDLVELPEWLCDLVQLRKLNISNCHKPSALPEGIGRLENLEVLRIHACTVLAGLPDSIGSLHKLAFLDISGCIRMSKLPEQMGKLCNLRMLCMRRCFRLTELPPSIMDLKQLKIISEDTRELHCL